MKIVTIVQGQSIWDIAIQEYGSVTSVFDFIADNGFADGLNTLLTPGQKVKIISAPSDKGVLQYFQTNKLRVVGGQFLPLVVSYACGVEPIAAVNNGGDDWTFTVAYDPLVLVGGLTLTGAEVSLSFFHLGVQTDILVRAMITATTAYHYTGLGAGTYFFNVTYRLSDSTFITAQGYFMVDGAGAIIRQANFDGFTAVTVSGLTISALAQYAFVNCTTSVFNMFAAFDSTFSQMVLLGSSDPLLNEVLPQFSIIYLIALFGFDYAEWADGPFSGDVSGCAMSLSTNII
jgi:hypothetical protein